MSSVQAAFRQRQYHYVISGLTVMSEVELPSAIPADAPVDGPDVTITCGSIPAALEGAEPFGEMLQIAGGSVRMVFPNTMTVLVEHGRSITLDRMAGAAEGDVVLFLLGTAFAVALQQRGRVVLHASAVAVDGKAMLFCGPSGAGKSTMAAMLSRRGFPLLNDDVCNLSRRADGRYEVYPDGRMLKLWSQSMQHLSVTPDETYRIRSDAEKFYLAPEAVDLTPRPVGGVYMLHTGDDGDAASLVKLPVAEAMIELTVNAYRPALVQAMTMQPEYFAASVSMTRHSGVYRLSRAKDFSRAEEVLDLLEASWAQDVTGDAVLEVRGA